MVLTVGGMQIHHIILILLVLAIAGVVMGSFGVMAYHANENDNHEESEVGRLTVNDNLTARRDVSVGRNLSAAGTLAVTGASTLTGAVTAASSITTNGPILAQQFYTGMTVSTVGTAGTRTYANNTITVNDYTGAAAQAVTLPAATVGSKVIHYQDADTTGGTLTLTFDCAGTDVYRTGSIILAGAAAAGSTLDTSTAGETLITFTPANAATNFISGGSQFVFWCVTAGIWEVMLDNSQCRNNTLTAVTGAIAFGA